MSGSNHKLVGFADNCDICGEPITDCVYEDGVVKYTVTFNKPHEHNYNETVTKEPSCDEPGEMTYECGCGDSYTKEIPTTEHDYIDTVVPPTDDEKGYTDHTCKDCGANH